MKRCSRAPAPLAWILALACMASAATPPEKDGGKGLGRLPPTPASTDESAAQINPSSSSGLFVGIGAFDEDSGLSTLGCAPDDAVALAYAFVLELGLLPPRQAFLALGGEPKYAQTRERLAELERAGVQRYPARKADVLRGLRKAADLAADPSGMLVVSFSSHGYEEKGQAFLMPSDGSRRNLEEMGIALNTLKRELREAKARKKLLIVDACRESVSGQTRGEERMSTGLQQAFKEAEGFGVLASCSAGQLSWEDPELQQGIFTHFLLEGLKPGAVRPGQGDLIRVGDLSRFAAEATRTWVQKNRRAEQIPFFEGDETSRMIPLLGTQAALRPAAKPAETVPSGKEPARPTAAPAATDKRRIYIFEMTFSPETLKNYPEWTKEMRSRGLGAQVYEVIKEQLGQYPQLEPYSLDEESELYKKIIAKLQLSGGKFDPAEVAIAIDCNFFFDRTKQKLTGFKVTKETEYHASVSLNAFWPGPKNNLATTSAMGDSYDTDPIRATKTASTKALKELLTKMGIK